MGWLSRIEVEEVAKGILVQEATALKPIAFTDMQMDAEHIVIKRKSQRTARRFVGHWVVPFIHWNTLTSRRTRRAPG